MASRIRLRYTGQRTKAVKARLGEPIDNEIDKNSPWPSLKEARKKVAERMTATLQSHVTQAERAHKLWSATLTFKRTQLVQRKRDEREKNRLAHEQRWSAET